MASRLKAQFEAQIADQSKDHTVEEVTETKEVQLKGWKHTGNSGGGHTGYDGKFTNKEVVTTTEVRKKAPPPQRSLADLP